MSQAPSPSLPRLRMFAGPNGSGKSRIKSMVEERHPDILGTYLNPDNLEADIKARGRFEPHVFGVSPDEEELLAYLRGSSFLQSAGLGEQVERLHWEGGALWFDQVAMNSYFASVLADFLRREMLRNRVSFSFETVMSAPDKVQLLREAQAAGYRTYLYYVATRDPEINVSRVANRVALGGHPVPADKIRARYERSLGFLLDAIRASHRAFLFDNSGDTTLWFAQINDGQELEYKADRAPRWFQTAVLDKLNS